MSGSPPHSPGIHIVAILLLLSAGALGQNGGREARPACTQKPLDCMFFFEGSLFSIPSLTSAGSYTSRPIWHRNGTVGFMDLRGGGPCKTGAAPEACKYFKAISGPPPPKRGKPPYIQLKPKTKATIKAVSGKCFQLYVGKVAIRVGGAREWTLLEWEKEHAYFPKKKRCVVFNVA